MDGLSKTHSRVPVEMGEEDTTQIRDVTQGAVHGGQPVATG
jgi:hypothetical protein